MTDANVEKKEKEKNTKNSNHTLNLFVLLSVCLVLGPGRAGVRG